MIPNGIIDHVDTLLALRDARDRAGVLVKVLEKEAIRALCETALNVILGNIPSDARQLSLLRQHREDLLTITDPKASDKSIYYRLGKPGVIASVLDVAYPLLEQWKNR